MTATIVSADSLVGDPHFGALLDFVLASTGLVYYADRAAALAGHFAQRLKARELDDCGAYLRLLQDEHTGEAELGKLIELLTIGETHFFRHRELFDALRDVALPEIIKRNQSSRRLRIWSAGCSNGAETYSLSILLRRELAHLTSGWNVSIIGTDVNRQFLAQATEGYYEEWAFRGTPPALRDECFLPAGKGWRIAPRFQDGVTFQCHNLAQHPYPSLAHNLMAFDLVLCRNVLIYFSAEFGEQVIGQLTDCLVDGGWLALGHSETCSRLPATLETVAGPGAVLFRKSATADDAKTPLACSTAPPAASAPAPLANGKPQIANRRDGVAGRPKLTRRGAPISSGVLSRGVAAEGATAGDSRPGAASSAALPEFTQMRALADQGRVDEALEICASLAAKNGLNPVYHFYQGLLLDQGGASQAALQCLQRAIYLDRSFELAHYYLGLAHQKRGNPAEAVKSFRNVARLLADVDGKRPLVGAEGLSAAELSDLAATHIEALETA